MGLAKRLNARHNSAFVARSEALERVLAAWY